MDAVQATVNTYFFSFISTLGAFIMDLSFQICSIGAAISYIVWTCAKDKQSGIMCFKFIIAYVVITIVEVAVKCVP